MATLTITGILTGLLYATAAVVIGTLGYISYPRWKQLTPLAKCVVLSVIAHVILFGILSQVQWATFTGPHNPRIRFVRGGSADYTTATDENATIAPLMSPPDPSETKADESAEEAAPEVERVAADEEHTQPSDQNSAGAVADTFYEPPAAAPPEPAAHDADDQPDAPLPATATAQQATPAPDIGLPPALTDLLAGATLESMASAALPLRAPELARLDQAAPLPTPTPALPTATETAPAIGPGDPRGLATPTDGAATPTNTTPLPHPAPPTPTPTPTPTANGATSIAAGVGAAAAAGSIYEGRSAAHRMAHVKAGGGDENTEAAVQTALKWLASVQEADGSWDPRKFGSGQAVEDIQRSQAGMNADTGVTGLATLCFLAAGHTHQEGEYRQVVQRSLEYLVSQQSAPGSLAGRAGHSDAMYCHGMATLALSEAYAMTKDARLQRPLSMALTFTLRMQDPITGGWRYTARQPGDMSQHGWQLMCLSSARHAGFEIPPQAFDRGSHFMQTVAAGRYGGLASYQPYKPPTPAMTAEALFCRLMTAPPAPAVVDEASQFLLQELPGTGRQPNLYYWYYGTLALYQVQGPAWDQWNQAMKRTLLARQSAQSSLAGSWDPDDDVYGRHGGRIYSTALATLSLEVYYRYLPLTVQVAQWNRQPQR